MITRYLAVTLIFRFRLYRRALFHCFFAYHCSSHRHQAANSGTLKLSFVIKLEILESLK